MLGAPPCPKWWTGGAKRAEPKPKAPSDRQPAHLKHGGQTKSNTIAKQYLEQENENKQTNHARSAEGNNPSDYP